MRLKPRPHGLDSFRKVSYLGVALKRQFLQKFLFQDFSKMFAVARAREFSSVPGPKAPLETLPEVVNISSRDYAGKFNRRVIRRSELPLLRENSREGREERVKMSRVAILEKERGTWRGRELCKAPLQRR